MRKEKRYQLGVILNPEDKRMLRILAAYKNMQMSELIRLLIKEKIDEFKKGFEK